MKILFKVLLIVLFTGVNFAQWDLTAGMGVNLTYTPDVNDYIRKLNTADQIETFNITAEFSIEAAKNISGNWQLGAEYGLSIYSFNSNFAGGIGNYTLSYNSHKPSLLAFYVISGNGYKLKFGGGAGYRFYSITEKISSEFSYSAQGFGLVMKIEGHTLLSDNLFAMLGGEIRQDFMGKPESSGSYLPNSAVTTNFNTFNIGLKIGVSYFF